MVDDAIVTAHVRAFIGRVDVPSPNVTQIKARVLASTAEPKRWTVRFAPFVAAAACLVAFVTFPRASFGFVESVEAQLARMLQRSLPPPPPAALRTENTHSVSIAEAQKSVNFTIVVPSGLPSDAVATETKLLPTLRYRRSTGTWSHGPAQVSFNYRRGNGATLSLVASKYDTAQVPAKYMFEDVGTRAKPQILRHLRFAWRNGDQEMTGIVGEGESANDLMAVRAAMHGIVIPTQWPLKPNSSSDQIRIPKP